jgi:hypothetical protein
LGTGEGGGGNSTTVLATVVYDGIKSVKE